MLTLKSPAKVNLFLKIVKRREDGYHDLASLFQAIDLCDRLHFELSEVDLIECTQAAIPIGSTNLVWKAIELFKRKTGLSFNLKVKIDKFIPVQAGLGGGSSNAATTLWGINRLLDFPVSVQELQKWSSEIGSDVPFFFSSGTAYCTGRGDIVHSLEPFPPETLWICKSEAGLSTPEVYRHLNIQKLHQHDPVSVLEGFMTGKPLYFNDLEETALKLLPALSSFKQQLLNQGFNTVMLSGSGSSFFCVGTAQKTISCSFDSPAIYLNRKIDEWY